MDTNIASSNITITTTYNCDECNVKFSDRNSLEKHILLHSFTEKCLTEAEMALRRKLLYQEVNKEQQDISSSDYNNVICSDQVSNDYKKYRRRRIYRRLSKNIGLTKVKMEDCLRCDACSCIYIDSADYYKHMKNFHEKYNTLIPGIRRKNPFDINIDKRTENLINNESSDDGGSINTETSKKKLSSQHISENIKNRWSKMISERLTIPSTETNIKCEPIGEQDYDVNSLISNVEVNIKIEPKEYFENTS